MASKNIMKFILKMVVAGLILAGIIYAIVKLTSPKTSQNEIINTSNNYNISEKYAQSFGDDFVIYANDAPSPNRKIRLSNANKINYFLLEHYDYYLSLTLFENTEQNADKEQIQNLIKSLSEQTDKTLETARLTKVQNLDNAERQRRLSNYADDYFKQTKIFFELNERLKNYVYKVNYNKTSTGIVYESQLEMVRDYCKAVFDNEIFDKYNDESAVDMITSGSDSSFSKVVYKFNNKSVDNKNSDIETKFVERYMTINKQTLKEFYCAMQEGSRTGKQDYINSITGENPTEVTTIKESLQALFDYMIQTEY